MMAQKRMFSVKVIDTDAFIDMPISARLLYYDLGMRADDDGFIASPKKIIKMIGASEDDIKILIAKGFIIPFDTGVCVIRHWRLNNYIQKDRYTATIYKSEMSTITELDGEYTKAEVMRTQNNSKMIENCIHNVDEMDTKRIQKSNKLDTQIRLDKNRLDLDKVSKDKEEIISYLNLKSGSNYRLIDSNLRMIENLFKKGYTKQDCMTVIDKKVEEWSGSDMQQYLRPITLFGSKFDGYLNQPNIKKRSEFEQTQDRLHKLFEQHGGGEDEQNRNNKNIFDI
jgi:uncharacterized phage protein (TIGR02220 family)